MKLAILTVLILSAILTVACFAKSENSPLVIYKHDKPYAGTDKYFIAIEPRSEHNKPFDPNNSHRIYYRFYEDAYFGFTEPNIGYVPQMLNFDFSSADLSNLKCVANDKLISDKAAISLECRTVSDGVDLFLTLKNLSRDYTWPAIACFNPCLTPGNTRGEPINAGSGNADPPICRNFADNDSRYTKTPKGLFWQYGPQPPSRTYFLATDGPQKLITNRHHFDFTFKDIILNEISQNPNRRVGFSPFLTDYSPSSDVYIQDSLMVRLSNDGWVAAIAWPRNHVLSAQGNNPQKCMHLSVRPGELKPSQQIRIRGKIYLFKGTLQDCLNRYRKDFDFDSLVAHWPLTNNTNDVSSNSLNGVLKANAAFADNALSLDGNSAYVQIPAFKGIPSAHPRTVSAWIKTDAPGDIISWGSDDAGSMFRLWLNDNYGNKKLGTNGALAVDVGAGFIVADTPLTDNRWHQVVSVLPYDCDNVTDIKLYVDGKPQTASTTCSQKINTADGSDVTIGVNNYIGLEPKSKLDSIATEKIKYRYQFQRKYFKGLIKNVRLYTRPLSQKEIAEQFKNAD